MGVKLAGIFSILKSHATVAGVIKFGFIDLKELTKGCIDTKAWKLEKSAKQFDSRNLFKNQLKPKIQKFKKFPL